MSSTEDWRSLQEPDADDDPRLVEALREYQAAVDAGQRPTRKEFLSRYPEIAGELGDCLAGLELLRSAAPRLTGPEQRPALPESALAPEGTLGDFRLVREIGRGGMGVVYEAVQLSLGRRVALKVLPLAATFDGRQLQRFENEARAAAHLHHGNIVPVFAVGNERGVPYYAMQFIDGRSLAAVIDDLRRKPAPAAPAAETVAAAGSITDQSLGGKGVFRAGARIGVQAAEALDYAHQMGVLHRDVKPANLLLDARGNLWVTDFGLARIQGSPGLTSPGDLLGTLRYMSPEQAAGRAVIDPRSDVYGMGVTLYELLTQRPAFPGRDRQECLRQILEEDPVALRQHNRAVPVELETIVLKAMAKAPEDRYNTARELADDLRRFLDDQPIRAKPPGLSERLAKWARRHRHVVAAAVLGLMVAVVALGVTAWRVSRAEARTQVAYAQLQREQERTEAAYRELQEEEQHTKAAWQEEAAQRARAEENYRQAREVLDFLNRLGVEEMAGKPQMQALRRRLLARLLDYYQAFIDQNGRDTPAADELAEAQLQVSELLVEVGRKADALAAFQKAMPQARGHGGPCGPPRGIAPLFLLGQPAVQKDLGLSEEQAGKVQALLDFHGRPPSNEEATAAEKGLAALLRSDQSQRLEQIIRQTRGAQGLLDPETAKALRLTERQKERIQPILDRARPGLCRPREGGEPDRHHPAGMPGRGRLGRRGPGGPRQAEEQALHMLSTEQRAQWQALQGKPFRGDLRVQPKASRRKARGTTTYAYYEGTWERLPDFSKLKPVAAGTGTAFDLGLARREESYGMKFEGFFRLERDEECTFVLASDDGARLFIDGKRVVDNDGQHPVRTRQGKVLLSKGIHKAVVTFFQTVRDAELAVEIQGPGVGRHNLGDLVAATEAELDRK
jgi:serine/threonine protein kinase